MYLAYDGPYCYDVPFASRIPRNPIEMTSNMCRKYLLLFAHEHVEFRIPVCLIFINQFINHLLG